MSEIRGHVVFDCDGTLVSTMEGIYQLLENFFSERLGRMVGRDEVIRNLDYNNWNMLRKYEFREDQHEVIYQEMMELWAVFETNREKKYMLFNGVKTLLDKLIADGFKVYVWTGRERPSTLEILDNIGIKEAFEDIRCRGDCDPKPSVAGLTEMLSGIDPNKIVVIGDSYADMQGAKAFEAWAIGCTWCENARADILTDYGADVIIDQPLDCYNWIIEKIK